MAYEFPPDLQQLVADRMLRGGYHSEDDVLRDALRALIDQQDDLMAVKDAIAELTNGDEGVPLDQAFRELRSRHGIAPDA